MPERSSHVSVAAPQWWTGPVERGEGLKRWDEEGIHPQNGGVELHELCR